MKNEKLEKNFENGRQKSLTIKKAFAIMYAFVKIEA